MRCDVGLRFLDFQVSVGLDKTIGVSSRWSECILHVRKE